MGIDFLKEMQLHNRMRTIVEDPRLSSVYHHQYTFTPSKYEELEEWEARSKLLKETILISAGIWPSPKRCELNATVFDKLTYDGFTVEKVVFESYHGFYVTGNLYRPSVGEGPFPGILNPHGHWENGRLQMSDMVEIPTRCANFAKMGFVAFSYDMIGYLDSKQIDHNFGGLDKELWGVGLLGLQLWNSIRSVDFLTSLQDVDTDKIGCTGESGGGTQTFLLGAIDERVKLCAPVNMISAHYQGGCLCENAPYLRLNGVTNLEIAAMFAPRPMLITGCTGDWTKNVPYLEFPYIQDIYRLYDALSHVDYFYIKADHNYNKATREAVYQWFGTHFLGSAAPRQEEKIDLGDVERFRIGTAVGKGHMDGEELFRYLQREKTERYWENNDLETGMRQYWKALQFLFGISAADERIQAEKAKSFYFGELLKHHDTERISVDQYVITAGTQRVQIPVTFMRNKTAIDRKETVLLIHPEGMTGLTNDSVCSKAVNRLLEDGYQVVSADLFLTGAYAQPYAKSGRNVTIDRFFTTYNYPDSAYRVQDIVNIYRFLNTGEYGKLHIAGLNQSGLWVLAALPFLQGVQSAEVDLNGFDIDLDESYIRDFFVPHFRSIGGFEACIDLADVKTLRLYRPSSSLRKTVAGKPAHAAIRIVDTLDDFAALNG